MRIIRERLLIITLVAAASVGLATGFALVAAPQYGASVLVLATGLALLAGLVFGVGAAFLVEYLANGWRSRERLQERPDLRSTDQESSKRESSES